MACHHWLVFQLLDMVKTDPRTLHIPSNLHAFDQIHSTTQLGRHTPWRQTIWLSISLRNGFYGKSIHSGLWIGALILSKVPMPNRIERLNPNTKSQQLDDANVVNLSQTTSNGARLMWWPSPWERDFKR